MEKGGIEGDLRRASQKEDGCLKMLWDRANIRKEERRWRR